MNPSPRVRDAIYLTLAIVNAVIFVFTFMTKTYTPEVLTALFGFNTLGFALANANVQK